MTMESAQWAEACSLLKLWTMGSDDTSIERALSRQASSFWDERDALVRKLRAQEEATDREAAKRIEAETRMKMLEEHHAAQLKNMTKELDAKQERIEELEVRLFMLENPGSPASACPSSPGYGAAGAADAAEEEAEEEDAGEEEEEAEEEEEEDPDAAFSEPSNEEVEYYREQTVEAEKALEASEQRVEELEAEVRRLKAQLDKALKAAESGGGGAAADRAVAEAAKAAAAAETAAAAAALKEAAALRAAAAASEKEAARLAKENKVLRGEVERLRQKREEDQREAAGSEALRAEMAQKDATVARLTKEFELMQVRYERLQQRVEQPSGQNNPGVEAVKSKAVEMAGAAARQMRGRYEEDYPALYSLFHDYEREIANLKNEVLSLQTIVGIREEDVGNSVAQKYLRINDELRGEITALKMQLEDKR